MTGTRNLVVERLSTFNITTHIKNVVTELLNDDHLRFSLTTIINVVSELYLIKKVLGTFDRVVKEY